MKEMNMKVGDRKRLMLALGLVEAPPDNTRNNLSLLCKPSSEKTFLINKPRSTEKTQSNCTRSARDIRTCAKRYILLNFTPK